MYLGTAISLFLLAKSDSSLMLPLVLAGTPAFLSGLTEDLTKKVGVWTRLGATFASGILACWLTGISLNRLVVDGVDWLLA